MPGDVGQAEQRERSQARQARRDESRDRGQDDGHGGASM